MPGCPPSAGAAARRRLMGHSGSSVFGSLSLTDKDVPGVAARVVQGIRLPAHQADVEMDGSFLDKPTSVCGPSLIRQSTLSVG